MRFFQINFLALIERDPVKLFFDLYHKMPTSSIADVFRNLTQLAAIRRTLLDTSERKRFLTEMLIGIRSVLQNFGKVEEPVSSSLEIFSWLATVLDALYRKMILG